MMLLFAVEYSESRSAQSKSVDAESKADASSSSGFVPSGCVVGQPISQGPSPPVSSPLDRTSNGGARSGEGGSIEIASVFAGIVPASMIESLKMEVGGAAKGVEFNLKDLFESGSGILKQPEPVWLKPFLEKTKDLLNENPDVKLVLIGMSESSEWFSDRYKTDWELGSARAAALALRLKKMGIEQTRLDVRAAGSRLGESTQVRVLLR
jgi:flagellar motor protein MotB